MNVEIPYTPPYELWKTDHGMGGAYDGRTWLVAKFTTKAKATAYVHSLGHTYMQAGGHYYHRDSDKRNTMGAISYEIRETKPEVPVDPPGLPVVR